MIVNTKDEKVPINVIIVPINCGPNDEEHIKRVIESRKNDPSTLLAIMARDVPRSLFPQLKPILDDVKKLIEVCESIDVSFLDLTEVQDFVKTLKQGSMLHNYCPN